MVTRTHITLLLLIAVLVWGGTLSLMQLPLTWDYSKPFAITVSVLSAGCFVFERWLWRWRIFRGWLVNRPDLQGTWKVLLKSDWVIPETKERIAPIECIMTIRQTYSRFSARLFTQDSSSHLIAYKIERQNDGVYQVFGIYQNTPDISLRGKRSEIHYGALVLEVRGEPARSLVGHYWTDRGTRGSLELTDRDAELLTGYQEGVDRFKLPA